MIASIAIAGEAVPDLRVYTTEGNKEECSKNQWVDNQVAAE